MSNIRNKFIKPFTIPVACLSALAIPAFADQAEHTQEGESVKLKQVQYKIGGRIQLDYDYFDGVHNQDNSGSGSEMRRGRIFFKSALTQNWEAKMQLEVNDRKKEAELKDAYVRYKSGKGFDLTIGKAKESFGLETIESANYVATIERAMISDAFAPSRSYGLGFFGQRGNVSLAGGVYADNQTETNRDTYAWTGRVTYAPRFGKNAFIHLGLAGSFRDFDGNDYQIKKPAEVHLANKIVQSAITQADNITLLGLESAVVFGPLSVRAEYMKVAINSVSDSGDSGASDADYDGYYIQADYFLTGETLSYKRGHFNVFNPKSAHNAWQLVTRFSQIDLADNDKGIEANNITLGVNHYVNSQIRLSANYILTDVKGPDTEELGKKNANALSLRLQYLF